MILVVKYYADQEGVWKPKNASNSWNVGAVAVLGMGFGLILLLICENILVLNLGICNTTSNF